MSRLRKELHGIDVACMMCDDKRAVWLVLNFFYCDDCVKKVD